MSLWSSDPICNAPEPTGATGDDGGPARCTRAPHPPGTMHAGNGLDWYDDPPRPVPPARPDPETAAALREAVARARRRSDEYAGKHGNPWAVAPHGWGTLESYIAQIASRLEAGERPLLYPESTPEKKET